MSYHISRYYERGVVYLELAIIAPIIIITGLLLYDLTNTFILRQRLLQLTGVIMNVARIANVKQATLNNLMSRMTQTDFSDFNIADTVQIIVSQVRDQNTIATLPADPVISWQLTYNGGVSNIGQVGNSPSLPPEALNFISKSKTLIIVETSFTAPDSPFIASTSLDATIMSPPIMGLSNVLL